MKLVLFLGFNQKQKHQNKSIKLTKKKPTKKTSNKEKKQYHRSYASTSCFFCCCFFVRSVKFKPAVMTGPSERLPFGGQSRSRSVVSVLGLRVRRDAGSKPQWPRTACPQRCPVTVRSPAHSQQVGRRGSQSQASKGPVGRARHGW